MTRAWWLILGAIVLVLLCALLVLPSHSALTPYPFHQLLLAFSTGYGFLLVLPITYLVTLAVLWNSRWLGLTVLVAAILLAALSVAWFVTSWGYIRSDNDGLIVTGENAIGIGLVLALSLIGFLRSARQVQAAAYFGIFALLAWCAFPYFGELP